MSKFYNTNLNILSSSQNILSRDILSQNTSQNQDISTQDISFIYEEPINGLKFYNTYTFSLEGSFSIWMILEDEDPACILPHLHLRFIDKTGKIKYMDFNYTLPAEAICPFNMEILPLAYNHIIIVYVKSNNGIKGKYGKIINYSNESINEIYLGNANGSVRFSISGKELISIEKPDKEGIAIWRLFSISDITRGKVIEHKNVEFHAPNLLSYTLVDSLSFSLTDGGFGFMYILKYDETKGSSVMRDPNLQYWRVYTSFLRVGADSPMAPFLVYQTTEKLNNLTIKLCTVTYNAEGYVCIMALNNTIINKKNNKSQTEVNYYQLRFLSTGAIVRLNIVSNPTNNTNIDLISLNYGGFLLQHSHNSVMNYYLLDDDGNYMQSQGSFGPEFIHFNMFRINNTIFGIKKQSNNKLEFLLKSLPRLNNHSTEYNCPIIETTKPAINEVIDPLIKEIMIKYTIPVKLSTANVSIFQLSDDPDKPDLLRQTFSGDYKLCTVGHDNYTVHIPIFESTFSQPNSSYYVLVENNFVISQERDEPLIGIKEKLWMLSTRPLKAAQHSDSITGILRLNEEGSLKFLQANHSIFFMNMIQEISKIIPKILLSFNINEAKDDNTVEPNTQTIFENLNTLIKQKRFTALSFNEYTSLIDESAPFIMTKDYFKEFYPLIIIFIAGLVVLIVLYILARIKNPKGKNFAIFETCFIIQDIAVDLVFILLKVKNTPHLIIPAKIFFILPIVINILLAINIFVSEMATNPSFSKWVSKSLTLSSICTLLSAIDIQILNTFSSDLFGLKIFSAPLTNISQKIMLWGSIISIFIEDVPQFIIQWLYYNSVITYDLIPTLALASGGLVIGNKLITRSYHALLRWSHRRDKVKEFIKRGHLSAASIRSIRSNVEN
ncbi:hypothetical protein GLOIN_2v1885764 [Rhizophagus irregularis DAOM 181602=DAOM 197198]|uniref:Uncharacterized protein n=1 Tax=Rhizophagus irregularis (strain DAOM 181602 / DAOM 197198 / MUCL 43194) TaxID=747089 RepID=A0A2P4NZI9_RHIID|nr:hypothetical protein GLOIN_2v1885764 [Rhizophagus irregularis DAOM 181602=DAOM 197198]POG58553.1 hypothetical protein GLOIN_2v1885764 [Rhizophagus irregularis DAOM 181602=DAOM 197198]|eukprot:XP_025165419.1 hypothetical protein GLOIN_2v1885764 [Rhizophagus irregularis DAOM 181602=DAOM 197198]